MSVPPTYWASGAVANLTASGTVALPSNLQVDDLLVLVIETANQDVSISVSGGGTWTAFPGGASGTGTAGGTSATRLTTFWSRYNGTQTAPTISDSGDHQIARIDAYRGVVTSGDPWDFVWGGTEAASDTSLVMSLGPNPLTPNCLIVSMHSVVDDAQNYGPVWTASSSGMAMNMRQNSSGTAGNDGRHILLTAPWPTTNPLGTVSNTLTASSPKAHVSFALIPAPQIYNFPTDPVAVTTSIAASALLLGHLLGAAPATVGLTPLDADRLKGSALALAPPAVSATAGDVVLEYTPFENYLLECEPVSLAVTVVDQTGTGSRTLVAAPVSISLTPRDASSTSGYGVAADAVSATVTVAAASLLRQYPLTAAAVSVGVTIADAGLLYAPAGSYLIALDPVSITLATELSFQHDHPFQMAPASIALAPAELLLQSGTIPRAPREHVLTVALPLQHTATTGILPYRHGTSGMDTFTCDNDTETCDDSHHTCDDTPMRYA